MPEPVYLKTSREGRLASKVEQSLALLESCTVCPRSCGVNRLKDERGFCHTGRRAKVSSFFPHLGEEDCLRGWRGSGTIFFSHCNLGCVFCQNYELSHEGEGDVVDPAQLAAMMLHLQSAGCHNINFVTPSHVVPQIIEALPLALEGGLRLPLVYNTSAYDSMASLELMDGLVDIHMPDFKFWSGHLAERFLTAADYPDTARRVFKEMHRQVGDLVIDKHGLAVRGVLVRHLVMPGCEEETRAILKFLAEDLSPNTFVNVMPQYRPAGEVRRDCFGELNRPLTLAEYERAMSTAHEVGLRRLDRR